MSKSIAEIRSEVVGFLHSGKFAEAVEGIEQLCGGFAVDVAADAVPAPVAPVVRVAGNDAVKLGADATGAALAGQPVAPVAKADATKLAKDVEGAINAALEQSLPGLLGTIASKVAAAIEPKL